MLDLRHPTLSPGFCRDLVSSLRGKNSLRCAAAVATLCRENELLRTRLLALAGAIPHALNRAQFADLCRDVGVPLHDPDPNAPPATLANALLFVGDTDKSPPSSTTPVVH